MKPVSKKVVVAFGTLVFVLIFNFFLFRIAGNPKNDLIRGNPRLSEAGRERLIHQRGLDQGLVTQFRIYLDDTLHGDFGTSFQTNQPVSTMMWEALPNTLILVGISTLLATLIGSWLGIYAAANRGSPGDTGVVQSSLFFYAMPDFWAGMVLIWFLPSSGSSRRARSPSPGRRSRRSATCGTSPSTPRCRSSRSPSESSGMRGHHALVARRHDGEDFVTTARAVGLPRHRVLRRATRNAILPMVALSAISLGFVVSGATVVETLFSWPGMGLLSYNAILNKDYPVMQGVFLVASAGVIIANLVADLAYTYLDPRVRSVSAEGTTVERAELPAERGFFGRMVAGTVHSLGLLRGSPSGMVGLFILVFFTLVAIFGPWIAPQDPAAASSYWTTSWPRRRRPTGSAPTRTGATSSRS